MGWLNGRLDRRSEWQFVQLNMVKTNLNELILQLNLCRSIPNAWNQYTNLFNQQINFKLTLKQKESIAY